MKAIDKKLLKLQNELDIIKPLIDLTEKAYFKNQADIGMYFSLISLKKRYEEFEKEYTKILDIKKIVFDK